MAEAQALSLAALGALRQRWQTGGQRVVLTNGVFDQLHLGHAGYLHAARQLGDVLVVAVNSDASVRANKGPLRPLVPEDQRAGLLMALRCVDAVTIFSQPTAETVVATLRPDVYVKGGDYSLAAHAGGKVPPEASIVQGYGGQVAFIPYAAGLSTTALIERIVARYRP